MSWLGALSSSACSSGEAAGPEGKAGLGLEEGQSNLHV